MSIRNPLEDRFQTQEGWWKQKYDQLEALFTTQLSTLAAPPEPEPDVHTTQPEPASRAPEPEA